jgi:signal transduction histidine kinase
MAAAAWLIGVGRLDRAWWLILAVFVVASLLSRVRERRWARVAAAAVTGAAAYVMPGALSELSIPAEIGNLLLPAPLTLALVLALTVLFGSLSVGGSRPWHWLVRLGGWALMLVGVGRGDAGVVAVGSAAAVLGGLPARSFAIASLMASAVLLASWDEMRKNAIVATTESTLALLEKADGPARVFLASMPASGLAELARLGPNESLVVLGRHADWSGLDERLPGTALLLADGTGRPVTAWGPVPPPGSAVRVLATRELSSGGSLSVVAPSPPLDLLESVISRGIDSPLAVFDQSGSPKGRGATFKPLAPEVVGRALAAQRSWATVGVGEREFLSYLRARGDTVLAVPWVRPPKAERTLMLAGLALWGALPLAVWRERARGREWWRERTTFVGRTRFLTAAATLLPVLLLGQLLPGQWLRQQQRARLEFGRAVAGPFQQEGWEPRLAWMAHEMGGAAAMYRGGRLVSSSRPDLVVRGEMPAMPPRTAYVRAIRGWGEPLVEGEEQVQIFVAALEEDQPSVLGLIGIPAVGVLGGSSPSEWFAVTGVLALLIALVAAERLGQRLALPLRKAVQAAERLERGEPFEEMPLSRDDDVAALGRAFAAMAETVQRREEELRRERDLLELVLGTLSAGVLVAAPGGTVELANPAARRLLGSSGMVASLGEHFGAVMADLVACGASGSPAEQVVHPEANPENVWRVTVLPLSKPVGRILIVMEDLSELARAERLASLAELARIVAHEVKNPLTPIRLWAEELQEALDGDPRVVVETARLATEHILERVEHLREVSQGFSNLVALERWNPERVDLASVAQAVTREYEVLRQRGVELHVEATPGVEVLIDQGWLERAVRHLFENSARALANRGGIIAVSVTEKGNTALLVVRDSGGGVAEEHVARLFEPFFSTTSDGSGLGLAVVRRVAERAGGRAEARNVDNGLEVSLVFPLAEVPRRGAGEDG